FAALLRCAGAALRAARNAVDHVMRYAPGLGEMNLEHLALRSGLGAAIARNEFLVFYQPTVDLRTGRVAGVEALVRWNHPQLGLLLPDRFIGLAEETQMIGAISVQVLMAATAAARRWRDMGYRDLKVAVNLSAGQL